jgi:hypothetical protein
MVNSSRVQNGAEKWRNGAARDCDLASPLNAKADRFVEYALMLHA